MSLLSWPGGGPADPPLDDAALLGALVRVEEAWLEALVDVGIAPAAARVPLTDRVGPADLADLAAGAGATGTPVAPLVALLRERLGSEPAAHWLHRGLTSQDVLDSGVMLLLRTAVTVLRERLDGQVEALAGHVRTHRDTPMVARTLTQPAVPTTAGLVAAAWLSGLLDARDELAGLRFPVQIGGAAGTLSAVVELADEPSARRLVEQVAATLGLEPAPPWHTVRTPVTRLADALVRLGDAWGHLAGDVLTLGRPEIGEIVDTSAGGSSTMGHKSNPVLAVLVRRVALAGPALAATLHQAAADRQDQRSDGAWQVEADTLLTLTRRAVVAAGQVGPLIEGLRFDVERMARALAGLPDDEQRAMAEVAGRPPAPGYLGVAGRLVDDVLTRAQR